MVILRFIESIFQPIYSTNCANPHDQFSLLKHYLSHKAKMQVVKVVNVINLIFFDIIPEFFRKASCLAMSTNSNTSWFKSLAPAFPVMMGYLPIGFAYGVLAVNAGLSIFQTVLMSVIVYAGSSQLIAASLFAQMVQPFSIIATTFIVNLRHMLMSAALAPHLREWRNGEVAAFSFELTDESFGIHSLRFERGENKPLASIRINLVCQLSWVIGSLIGAVTGNIIEDVRPFALDYALPAMFIALLVLQIRNRRHLIIAVLGGVLSLVIWLFGATQWNVIFATIVAAAVGAGLDTWAHPRS